MDDIDWVRLGIAPEHQTLHTQIWLIKFMHNWLNTGSQKQKFHEDTVADCPVCCAEDEMWMHMFQCPHNDAILLRSLALTKFKSSLIKIQTAPIIQQVLYYKVSQWCKMLSLQPPRILTDIAGTKLCNAVETQHDLGWNNFMKGRIAKQWCMAQTVYCCSFPKPKEFGERQLTTKLIKAIWTMFVDV
eukprot:11804033-Ditylum_brightwellii.AAC.1